MKKFLVGFATFTFVMLSPACTITQVTPLAPSGTPSASPTAAPSPSAVPSPSPTASPVAGVRYFNTQNITTTAPSFLGARVGAYPDVLVPATGVGAIADVGSAPTGFPAYAELDFDNVMKAFGIVDQGSTIAQRGTIYTQVIQMLLSFGVQPVKQMVGVEPTDWDANSQYGLSFKQLVLNPAFPYPPCVSGPNPKSAGNAGGHSVAFLQKVEAGLLDGSIKAGAFTYLYDEPTQAQHADLIAQAQMVRANAPHLKIYVTMMPTADVAGLVDEFAPIFESYASVTPKAFSTYGSCSSAGSCSGGNASPGTPSGTPMMIVDADSVNWTAYPVVAAALGAQSVLYYNTTQQLSMSPGGMMFDNGNGDGTLVYAGSNFTVWPSARLLGFKRGLQKIAAMKAQGKPLSSLVTDAKHWSHTLSDYAP